MVSMQAIRNFVRNRLAAYGALALASLSCGEGPISNAGVTARRRWPHGPWCRTSRGACDQLRRRLPAQKGFGHIRAGR